MKKQPIVPLRTVRNIRCGVVAAHLFTVMLILAFSVVVDWVNEPEDTITIQFYDPKLDNIVENPSPDPDPSNPIPPSGTQDGAKQQPEPEPQPEPVTPPKILTPEPVKNIAQPKIQPRALPKVAVNKTLPAPKAVPTAKSISQPKISKRKLPASASKPKQSNSGKNNRSTAGKSGNKGPRGSNPQPGHTAPGGQKGNSGYDIQVAMMIKRMWETPDSNRLGGRKPRVLIEVQIAPDGRVVSKRIRTASGVLAMDESIRFLLNKLRYVKRPFDNKTHTLVFWLKAE